MAFVSQLVVNCHCVRLGSNDFEKVYIQFQGPDFLLDPVLVEDGTFSLGLKLCLAWVAVSVPLRNLYFSGLF